MKIPSKYKYVAVDKKGRVVNRFTKGGLGGKLSALCFIRGDLNRKREKVAGEYGEMSKRYKSGYDKLYLKAVINGKPSRTEGHCGYDASDGLDRSTSCRLRIHRPSFARGGSAWKERVINPCEGGVGGKRDAIYQYAAKGQRGDRDGLVLAGTRKRKSRKRRSRR